MVLFLLINKDYKMHIEFLEIFCRTVCRRKLNFLSLNERETCRMRNLEVELIRENWITTLRVHDGGNGKERVRVPARCGAGAVVFQDWSKRCVLWWREQQRLGVTLWFGKTVCRSRKGKTQRVKYKKENYILPKKIVPQIILCILNFQNAQLAP